MMFKRCFDDIEEDTYDDIFVQQERDDTEDLSLLENFIISNTQVKKTKSFNTPEINAFINPNFVVTKVIGKTSTFEIIFFGFPDHCPSRFEIQIPKYYPHNPPTIYISPCLDTVLRPNIDLHSGELKHPMLELRNWSPLNSLGYILQIVTTASLDFDQPPEAAFSPLSILSVGECNDEDNHIAAFQDHKDTSMDL